MTWNYRIIKKKTKIKTTLGDKIVVSYAIHECYYNKDGSIHAISQNPVTFGADEYESDIDDEEAKESIIEALKRAFKNAKNYPILEDPFPDKREIK